MIAFLASLRRLFAAERGIVSRTRDREMAHFARTGLAIAIGVAATASSAIFGVSQLSHPIYSTRPRICSAAAPGPQARTRIIWGVTRLRYFEDDNELQLILEMTTHYDIVYVPTARRWPQRMPEWARHRRDDIMAEIKRLAVGHPVRWVDDDIS
jgi:hypothetical protein